MTEQELGDPEDRKAVRLRIQQGTVVLRAPGLEDAEGALEDISEGGLKCRLPFTLLPPPVVKAWKACLEVGGELTVEVTFRPILERVVLPAQVRRSLPAALGTQEVGLAFHHLNEEQRELVNRAVLSLAAGKVRKAFGTIGPAGPAAYLVGGKTPTPAPIPAPVAANLGLTQAPPGAPASRRDAESGSALRNKPGLGASFFICEAGGRRIDPRRYSAVALEVSEQSLKLIAAGPADFGSERAAEPRRRLEVWIESPPYQLRAVCRIRSIRPVASGSADFPWSLELKIGRASCRERVFLLV